MASLACGFSAAVMAVTSSAIVAQEPQVPVGLFDPGGLQHSDWGRLGGKYGAREDGRVKLRAQPRTRAWAEAIDRGLLWLSGQQAENGRFGPEDAHAVGRTATVVLAFLGDGHDPFSGEYRDVVRAGIAWLVGQQQPAGLIACRGAGAAEREEHALATLALVEAAGHGPAPRLVDATTRALEWLATYAGDGAAVLEPQCDAWSAMAWIQGSELGLAPEERLDYDALVARCVEHPRRLPGVALTVGTFARSLDRVAVEFDAEAFAATVEGLTHEQPTGMLFALLGLHQAAAYGPVGESAWQRARRVLDGLTPKQREDGDLRGSWDPPEGGASACRWTTTALYVLALETPYRFTRLVR